MIAINLLPPEQRKRQGVPGAGFPWSAAGKVGVGVVVFISGCLPISNRIQSQQLHRLEAQWEAMATDRAKLEGVRRALESLQARAQVMEALNAPQSRWAPRLNLLSDALVSDLWFTRLVVTKEGALQLEGSSLVTESSKGASVTRFLQKLETQPEFGRWFAQPSLQSVQQRQVAGQEIVDFVIWLSSEGQG